MAAVVDPAKARLVRSVAADKVGFWSGALDAAGKRLFVGGTDFAIRAFDLPEVKPAPIGPLKGHQSYVTSLVFVPQTKQLISGGFDKQLIWWSPSGSVAPIRKLSVGGLVNRLAVTWEGALLAAATDDLTARIWETGSGQLVRACKGGHPPRTNLGRNNTLYSVAFSPDGRKLATGDRAGTVAFWEIASGKLLHLSQAPAFYSRGEIQGGSEYEWGGIRTLTFTPDGAFLVAGGMGPADRNSAGIDGAMRLEIFDAATGSSAAAFSTPGFKGLLNAGTFLSAAPWLVAGGGGGQAGNAGIGSLCLWNYRQRDKAGKMVAPVMLKGVAVVRDVVLSLDNATLYAVGMERDLTAGRVEIWDLTGAAPAPTPTKPRMA